MEKDKLESMLIDYLDGQLNEYERTQVEHELKENPEAAKLLEQLSTVINAMNTATPAEPSPKLQYKFDELLQQEIKEQQKAKQVSFWSDLYKIAAALLLIIVGGGIGYWLSRDQKKDDEMRAMRKELEQVKQMMIAQMEDSQSPGKRILAVQTAAHTETADIEILDALIKVMNEDPTNNVRITAIEALARFHENPHVRKALVTSLGVQKDPVVQIALIQLMVKIQEKRALKTLERISEDDHVLPAVKDEAHMGIFKLS